MLRLLFKIMEILLIKFLIVEDYNTAVSTFMQLSITKHA